MELQPDNADAYIRTLESRIRALEGTARGPVLNQSFSFAIAFDGFTGFTWPVGFDAWTDLAEWYQDGASATQGVLIDVPQSRKALVEFDLTISYSLTGTDSMRVFFGCRMDGANDNSDLLTDPTVEDWIEGENYFVEWAKYASLGANVLTGVESFHVSLPYYALNPGPTGFTPIAWCASGSGRELGGGGQLICKAYPL